MGEVFLLAAGLTIGMSVRAVFGNRFWSVFNQIKAELVADNEGTEYSQAGKKISS